MARIAMKSHKQTPNYGDSWW